jgi:hypothetical protein
MLKKNRITPFHSFHPLFISTVILSIALLGCKHKVEFSTISKPHQITIKEGELTDGDIIFQTNSSDFSNAIKLATHSHYSHCGIIFRWKGKHYVYEAIQPVSFQLLEDWISSGDSGHYVVKRLKDAFNIMTPEVCCKMAETGKSFLGKDYDCVFGWTDNRIYCSELVWKIYNRAAGIEIGKLRKLKEFDLSSELVKEQLYKYYNKYIPYDETIISPEDMFNSPLLINIKKE